MKHFSYITVLTLTLFTSCSEQIIDNGGITACKEVDYGDVFEMELNEAVCFPDGNEMILKVVEDQFCPCEAVCIWQGELVIILEATESNGEKKLISLGSESLELSDPLFANTSTQSYLYRYENDEELPLCDGDFEPSKVTISLSIVEE